MWSFAGTGTDFTGHRRMGAALVQEEASSMPLYVIVEVCFVWLLLHRYLAGACILVKMYNVLLCFHT